MRRNRNRTNTLTTNSVEVVKDLAWLNNNVSCFEPEDEVLQDPFPDPLTPERLKETDVSIVRKKVPLKSTRRLKKQKSSGSKFERDHDTLKLKFIAKQIRMKRSKKKIKCNKRVYTQEDEEVSFSVQEQFKCGKEINVSEDEVIIIEDDVEEGDSPGEDLVEIENDCLTPPESVEKETVLTNEKIRQIVENFQPSHDSQDSCEIQLESLDLDLRETLDNVFVLLEVTGLLNYLTL